MNWKTSPQIKNLKKQISHLRSHYFSYGNFIYYSIDNFLTVQTFSPILAWRPMWNRLKYLIVKKVFIFSVIVICKMDLLAILREGLDAGGIFIHFIEFSDVNITVI